MKKHNAIFTGIFGILLVFGIGFIGCDLLNNDNANDDIAIVSIKLPKQDVRSAYTGELINQTTGYQLTVTKVGTEVYNNTFPANQASIQIELTSGSHTFVLNAMKNNDILGSGSTTVELVKGNNSVDIVLIPITEQETIDNSAYVDINVSWQEYTAFTLGENESIYDIAVDDLGGVFIIGYTSGDLYSGGYTARLNRDFELVWKTSYKTDVVESGGITTDGINEYIIGWGGPVIKYSPGNMEPVIISDRNTGFGYRITADISGNTYFCTNDGIRSLMPDCTTIRWDSPYPDISIFESASFFPTNIFIGGDGGLYYTGIVRDGGSYDGGMNGFVIKVNMSTGQHIWERAFHIDTYDETVISTVLSDGSVIVAAGGEKTFRWDSTGIALEPWTYIAKVKSYGDRIYGIKNGSNLQEFNFEGVIIKDYQEITSFKWPGWDGGDEGIEVNADYIYYWQGNIIKRYEK